MKDFEIEGKKGNPPLNKYKGGEIMEIKAGMYIRENNEIMIIKSHKIDSHLYIERKSGSTYRFDNSYKERLRYANTPQELIEVGDLVEWTRGTRKGNYADVRLILVHDLGDKIITNLIFTSTECSIDKVTKILTPNSNGGYNLQWEANNGTK